ncbi:hypothetical protein ACG91E_20565, partial [Acinetobacter nosocomialis]|uniref:hypothetical protein n=1 Tax=Acinetobacter nosocomialis TaxID=106654 RepID=UPI003AF45BCC
GADVTVDMGTTAWMAPGQVLFVEGGGYYTAVPASGTQVRLTNLGYTGNAAPGTVINPPQLVSPGGLRGPAVTYQITFKPGGVAVPGQVYTTDASLR